VLEDLEGWFSDQGMLRADYGSFNVRDEDHLVMDWTDTTRTILVRRRGGSWGSPLVVVGSRGSTLSRDSTVDTRTVTT
jgi:hypothetical protein